MMLLVVLLMEHFGRSYQEGQLFHAGLPGALILRDDRFIVSFLVMTTKVIDPI
jgi:hypothetical protein